MLLNKQNPRAVCSGICFFSQNRYVFVRKKKNKTERSEAASRQSAKLRQEFLSVIELIAKIFGAVEQ